jgi:hypothetical protein
LQKIDWLGRYPQASMPTYLRFVVADIHDNSGKELGVFHAVLGLREAGKLAEHEEELHDLTRQWFNDNLEKPTRFTASKPPFYRKPNKSQIVVQEQRKGSPRAH